MSLEAHRQYACSDVGRTREHNEDRFLCDPSLGLYAVADGMGGHAAGEVAASLAVEVLSTAVRRGWGRVEAFVQGAEAGGAESVKALLAEAVREANAAVYDAARGDEGRRGMGTTLTAMLLVGDRAFLAHVGDSRVYLLRGGAVRLLTEDHSVINELRRRGRLQPESLAQVRHKNAITRAVGVFETVEVDTYMFLAAPGDRYLLCSDGLYRYITDDAELVSLLSDFSEEAVAQGLIVHANGRGGVDNITAVVVTLPETTARAQVLRDLAHQYEALSALPFFRHVPARELLHLQAMARLRDVGPGEAVVQEGSEGDAMFVIVAGRCAVRKGDVELARLGPGENFGEMSLVERAPRSASVVAEEDTRLLEFSRADLFRVLRASPDTGITLLWNLITILVGRLRETSTQLGEAREALLAEDLTAHLFLEEYHTLLPALEGPRGAAAPVERDTQPSPPDPDAEPVEIPAAPRLPRAEA